MGSNGEGQADQPDFTISHQTLLLDVNFATRSVVGSTSITINPLSEDLREIPINFRQGRITRLTINGRAPSTRHDDWWKFNSSYLTARQWIELQEKLDRRTSIEPDPELILTLSKKPERPVPKLKLFKSREEPQDATVTDSRNGEDLKFNQLELKIDFVIEYARDGLQFIGLDESDLRYPHVFTTNSQFVAGKSSCLFPCVDSLWSRHTFELTIKSPKTLADAVRADRESIIQSDMKLNGGRKRKFSEYRFSEEHTSRVRALNPQDELLEMVAVGAGDFISEDVDPANPRKKISKFVSASPVSPLHIGFAIGPFQKFDMSKYREAEDDDKLGQNAVPIQAYHLPGRVEVVENTCMPMANIIDFYTLTFGSYPCTDYRLCFVDDLAQDTTEMLSMSLCSNRILYPENIIEFLNETTRKLAHALACQWIGIDVIPSTWGDAWAVIGIAYFMADLAMKRLCGNNEYRLWQKKQAGRVCQEDVDRPPIADLGPWILLDSKELDFVALKAPVVLFILDRRIAKSTGSSGLSRIVSRIFLNMKAGELANGELSTAYFIRVCEKLGHLKLDVFFNQWVSGAGCPKFFVQQKFNKKKMVLEMAIRQEQAQAQAQTAAQERTLNPHDFIRNVKEDNVEVEAGNLQPAFLGPMTIRIHEADGTPYEHIVEIQAVTTKFDIPYNTKYKRLKRSRRQKERTAAVTGNTEEVADSEDTLLYCLGDVLQSEEEVKEWRLNDWEKEMESKMENESFEWIRLDADFEWICSIHCPMQPYMLVSQLQQDRDIVAQYEAIESIRTIPPHPIMSTIFVRTIMDKRYFHGIRVAAAEALILCALESLQWIGLFHLEMAYKTLFGFSNDFSDRASYYLQKTIPRMIAKVRDQGGRPTKRVQTFVLDKLKFNDNASNSFSDAYYIENLIKALTDLMTAPFHVDEDSREDDIHFLKSALDEIERYQRMDLWESSHHNIYTVASLRCKKQLMKAKRLPPRIEEFLSYTKPGTSDFLCVEAFRCMLEVFTIKNKPIVPYFLQVLSTDRSPFLRNALFEIFGQNLGLVAIGLHKADKASNNGNSFLTIETDDGTAATQARHEELKRKTSLDGAVKALRHELMTGSSPASRQVDPGEPLLSALWRAVNSQHITFHEQRALLLICQILYEPNRGHLVRLLYPRFPKKVEYKGDGYVVFYTGDKARTMPTATRQKLPSAATARESKVKTEDGEVNRGRSIIIAPPAAAAAARPDSRTGEEQECLPAGVRRKIPNPNRTGLVAASDAASPAAAGSPKQKSDSSAPVAPKSKPLKLKLRLSGSGLGKGAGSP